MSTLLFAAIPAQTFADCSAADEFPRASALLAKRQFDDAVKLLDPLRACGHLSSIERFQLGWMYGRARRFKVAMEVFRTVPADVPDRPTHDYAVALSAFELSDYVSVVETFKAARDAHTLDENSANLMAVAYSKLKEFQNAYELLAGQIQKEPGSLNTHLNLITVCAEGGNYDAAASAAGDAIRLFPQAAEPLISRGAANLMLGKTTLAFEDFSAGAKLARQRADARFFMALTKYKEDRYSDAVSILKGAIEEGLHDSDLHYLLAESLLRTGQGNRAAALLQLDSAIAIDHSSEAALTLRGKLLLESGRPEQAIADLELAARQDPSSKSACYTLARAYRAAGKESDASRLFAKLREQPATTLDEMSEKRLAGVLSSSEMKVQ